MIKKMIKDLTSTHEKKRLVGNFFSLSFLQAATYIFPLITLPYLVRVLGVEKYGLLAFAQAFVQYFVILTDYGFSLSATREVSIHRDNKVKLSLVVSSVFIIKAALFLLSTLILTVMLLTIPKFRGDWPVYALSFGMVFDNLLFPVWFFQGIENMKCIALRNVAAKLVFTVLIFVFVRQPGDYLNVPMINSLGMIVAGGIGLAAVFSSFGVSFVRPSGNEIWTHIRGGSHIFISRLATSLYTTTNTVILGLFMNNVVVGYYAAGEKIVRMITQMFEPLFRAVYPCITKKAADHRSQAVRQLRKVLRLSFFASLVVFVALLIFSGSIVRILLGSQFMNSIDIVRVLSPLVLIIPASYVFANLGLLSFRLDAQFLRIYLCGGAINALFLGLFLGAFHLSGIGAALASVSTEAVLLISMWNVLRLNHVRLFIF